MHNYEKGQIEKLTSKKSIPAFRAGDTLKITLKIIEGERSRLQVYEGMCIARKNNLLNSKFTVRKISHGEGVERVFPLFSPNIEKIEVVRKGGVKRAKLYYLRKRTGKSARIADKDRGDEIDQYESVEEHQSETDISSKNEKNNILNEDSEKNNTENDSNNEKLKEEKKEKETSVENKSESSAEKAENTENESKS